MLEKLGVAKGHIDLEDIDLEGVIQEAMNARRDTVHMANAWLTTVSNMFDWAMQEQTDPETGRLFRLDSNPCEFVKRLKAPKKGHDDLDEEEDGHPTFSTMTWPRSRPPTRTAAGSACGTRCCSAPGFGWATRPA